MKVRWGIISTARIGVEKVIPAMQQGQYCEIAAIASRELPAAQAAARELGIPTAYGSYEALLADSQIDAIYNPLPNHLHVPWSIKALQAGKHVLCEKPIAMSANEAQQLADVAALYPHLKVMEAFMYRLHPQWQRALQLVREGAIGDLHTVQSFFSYYNTDASNIRNIAAVGGGGLMDIGCYNISISRFIFGSEPRRVCGIIENDPDFQTDRMTSAVLEFEHGSATFTCSTQLSSYQRVNIFGNEGRIEIEIPFNAPTDRPCRIWQQHGSTITTIELETSNQYTLQGDAFSKAILENGPVPTPISDAVANMRIIDAIRRSAQQGGWVTPGGA